MSKGRRALTPDMISQAKALCIQAMRAGNTQLNAAAYAGIAQQTFYRWREKDKEFRERLEKAAADAEALCVSKILTAANEGTWQAAAWWLERRRRDDWGRHDRLDVTNENALQVTRTVIVITDDMPKPALPFIENPDSESGPIEGGASEA